MKSKIAMANWKMHGDRATWRRLARGIAQGTAASGVDVVICPPYPALADVEEVLKDTSVSLGAPNVHQFDTGAYTGEVSAPILKEFGCKYVIIGHSERREYFGENNNLDLSEKIRQCIRHDLVPVYCVGETWQQREEGKTFTVLDEQLLDGLNDVYISMPNQLIVAYEPVWAISALIGERKTPTADDLKEVFRYMRQAMIDKYGEFGHDIRLIYGGSVGESNVKSFMEVEGLNGVLVGGASLDDKVFSDIVQKISEG